MPLTIEILILLDKIQYNICILSTYYILYLFIKLHVDKIYLVIKLFVDKF